MAIHLITQVHNLAGKRVLVRVDFNVPMKGKKILDDSRLHASLPTITYLLKKKAKVILITHVGRPEGKIVPSLSVKPIAKRLAELLHCNIVTVSSSWRGKAVEKKIIQMNQGDVVMLENIRFFSEEQDNKGTLAKELAALGDIFVLDGFAVSHRSDASVSGIARYIPSYAGLLLTKEITGLDAVLKKPKAPFVVIIGGKKTETKIPVMKNVLPKADYMLIGGGIVNTYLHGSGYGVGGSFVDIDFQKIARAYGKKKKVICPIDAVVGTKDGKNFRVVEIQKRPHEICGAGEAIFDIGPLTIQLFSEYIVQAKTIVWNGALGYFEQSPYDVGTRAIAECIAEQSKRGAYSVIGGGETVQTMEMVGMTKYIDLVSTGGGAMLEFLAGEKLPGIVALKNRR